jgi:methionine biosynthesis protein MetW
MKKNSPSARPRRGRSTPAAHPAKSYAPSRPDLAIAPHDAALLDAFREMMGAAEAHAGERVVRSARWQDALIERTIPHGASVLDLGCGEGELLERLIRMRRVRGQGIELDAESVMACVRRGVPVFQSDLDEGLKGFPSGGFDFVVLEETAQALHRPLCVLEEMLRVGRKSIVSFPNFAYWRVRISLMLEGRMPVTDRLPYGWFDTPNIHLFTLQDFLDWVQRERIRVDAAHVYIDGRIRPMSEGDNLLAEEAMLILSRS